MNTPNLEQFLYQTVHLLDNLDVEKEEKEVLFALRIRVRQALDHALKKEMMEAILILDEVESPINEIVLRASTRDTIPPSGEYPISK